MELRDGIEPTLFLVTNQVHHQLVRTKRKWRKVLKVVYTEGIEPSFIVFKTIVLTISRSNTFNHHPFVGVAGLEPATNRVSGDYSNQLSYTPIL